MEIAEASTSFTITKADKKIKKNAIASIQKATENQKLLQNLCLALKSSKSEHQKQKSLKKEATIQCLKVVLHVLEEFLEMCNSDTNGQKASDQTLSNF